MSRLPLVFVGDSGPSRVPTGRPILGTVRGGFRGVLANRWPLQRTDLSGTTEKLESVPELRPALPHIDNHWCA